MYQQNKSKIQNGLNGLPAREIESTFFQVEKQQGVPELFHFNVKYRVNKNLINFKATKKKKPLLEKSLTLLKKNFSDTHSCINVVKIL